MSRYGNGLKSFAVVKKQYVDFTQVLQGVCKVVARRLSTQTNIHTAS